MTRSEMLDELRLLLDDTGFDPAWTQRSLLLALSEGQDKFCEDTGLFIDKTNYTITTEVGVDSYPLSDRIIAVLDVFDSASRRLGKFSEEDRRPELPAGRPWVMDTNQRVPTSWQLDHDGGALTLYPIPDAIETYTLRVWRYPRFALHDDDIDGDGTEAQPELKERFQWACIEWAAFKLLRHHDLEIENKHKSTDHYAAYKAYVSEGKTAHNRARGFDMRVGGNPLYVV